MLRLFAIVLSLGLAVPAAAGPLEDGFAAYQRGDFATTLRLMRPLAEDGNASAQALLGLIYALGQGVPRTMQWRSPGTAKPPSGVSPAPNRISPRCTTRAWG